MQRGNDAEQKRCHGAAIPYLSGELRQVGEGVPRLAQVQKRNDRMYEREHAGYTMDRCPKLQTFSQLSEFFSRHRRSAPHHLCPSTYLKQR